MNRWLLLKLPLEPDRGRPSWCHREHRWDRFSPDLQGQDFKKLLLKSQSEPYRPVLPQTPQLGSIFFNF